MIFRKMILNNFRPYYTENKPQEIEFSSGEKNVTLIKAENGTGKTTLLEAFKWCFYGEKLNLPSPNSFVNEKAFSEMTIGSTIKIQVTIEFEERGKLYKIIRTVEQEKTKLDKEKNKSKIFILKNLSDGFHYEGNSAEDKIKELLPKDLNFFFDGERLNQMEEKKEKRNEIVSVLGIKVFENASIDLKKVIRRYENKILESEKENREYHKLTKKRAETKARRDEIIKSQEKNEAKKDEFQKSVLRIEEKLDEVINKISQKGDLGKQLGEAEILKRQLEEKYNNTFLNYKDKLTKRAPYILSQNIMKSSFNMLEEARSKGKIPSNIRETLLNDLISAKKCICGRELGEEQIKELNLLKKSSTDAELEDIFNGVYRSLKTNITLNKNRENSKNQDKKELEKLKIEYIRLRRESEEATERLDILSEQYKDEDRENIMKRDEYQQQLRSSRKNIEALISVISTEKEQINNLFGEMKGLKNKIDTQRIKKESEIYKRSLIMSRKLLEVTNELYSYKLDDERKKLNEKIKKIYMKVTRKGYHIDLNEKFELKVYRDEKKSKEVALSTGETKMVVLCFIGALVDLARKLNNKNDELEANGGIYPIVLDSPYGDLDNEHKREMTTAIQQLSEQIILFASSSQWSEDVQELMKGRVGKKYELNNKNKKNSNEKHEFTIIKEVGV